MRISTKKLIALMIAVILVLPMIFTSLVAFAEERTFTFDATNDLSAMAAGAKQTGESDKVGTDNYFTLFYHSKTKIDSSSKTFEDGYSASQRINMQSKAVFEDGKIGAAIGFTTTGPATVKAWIVYGKPDGRYLTIFDKDGTQVAQDTALYEENNAMHIATLSLTEAGTYYLGSVVNGLYIFKVEVTEHNYVNLNAPVAWDRVHTPVVQSHTVNEDGELEIKVDAQVGRGSNGIYADSVNLTVKGGDVYNEHSSSSVADATTHNFTISPEWSGTYTVTATLTREGSEDKVSADYIVEYVLPLGTPYLSSATSKGGGTVELEYTEVREAEKYVIYCGGEVVGETTDLIYTVSGLTAGQKYGFKVEAVRGETKMMSAEVKATVTEESKTTWGFTYYGESTNAAGNGYIGNLNEDGKVTVYSEGGKGKIQPASTDGIAFYYTKIPTTKNFTLRSTVTVDSWTYSNGQEGFGLMVTDRLGKAGDSSKFWNNQYMAGTTKIEYRYEANDSGTEYIYDTSTTLGSKYTMKLGLGMIAKTGVTPENLPRLDAGDTDTLNNEFVSVVNPLELSAPRSAEAGTYNVVGNSTSPVDGSLNTLLTTFVLEIERNNTGYFIRYYDTNGNLVREIKNYDPDALDQLDSEFVYAGFFASRNARATFSDVSLTTIDPADDKPIEERPITYVTPTITITSATTTTNKDYVFAINTNVDGVIRILNTRGDVIVDSTKIEGKKRIYLPVELSGYGEHDYSVEFDPDDTQDLGEYTQLIDTYNVYAGHTITYAAGNYHRKSVYVSVDGKHYGTGSKEEPYDLETAIKNAIPGQTIILMEGTYKFHGDGQILKIERGINGTETDPIRLVADPNAATRPVIDFGGKGFGITHGGDWWVFEGFDVTGSANGQKGFQISGNHNVLIDIHAYRNGNTGIQLSRYSGTDYEIEQWPSYNLILNCDSYYNMDAGHEDADGFAAKLTCGPGNVFDGCVAYNNADDGWDLYAKVQTGMIGAVEIRNCVSYKNGYLEDGTASKGNGNGFKMGGESLSGHHVIKNSIAFNNRAKGIDSNSCPDIEAYNCISFNNGSYNYAFYTNNATNTAFKANGLISLRTSEGTDENLRGKGTQVEADYINETTFYWTSGVCVNSKGAKLTTDIFVSLEFDFEAGVGRNADGTINLGDFLKIKDGAVPEGVGTTGASTASPEIKLPADLEHNYGDSWVNTDPKVHWQECECGDKAHTGEHTFEYVIDKEPTETEVGYRHRECTVCGYKKATVEIQPLGSQQQPEPPVDTTPNEEPTGFQAIWQTIVEFFQNIVAWFKDLFSGFKK